MFGDLRRGIGEVAEPIVILRPIDERDIAAMGALGEVLPIYDPSIGPEIHAPNRAAHGAKADCAFFQRARICHVPTQEFAGPWRGQLGHVVAPELIMVRLLNYMIFSRQLIYGDAARDR